MDMKRILESIIKFAGEPKQKPGDQVRGTEKTPKDKDHPFKGRLVGAAESQEPSLKELNKLAEDKSLEWQLMEEFSQFKENEPTDEIPLADLSKIRTDRLQKLVALHRHYGQTDPASKKAAIRGAAELLKRGIYIPIDEEKENFGVGEKRKGRKTRERAKDDKVLESDTVITERTVDEEWQGWIIRYETAPVTADKPVRWMVYHKKRGPEDAHFGEAGDAKTAVEMAKEWIQTGGNAKEITTNQNITIDFNARFVNEILNGGRDFFAKIVAGPTLIIRDEPAPGFKRSSIRTQKDKITEKTTLVPAIVISGNEAAAAGLKAHGRYILGDTSRDNNGNVSFPLIYQSTVQSKRDKLHLSKPALTVAMRRDITGESIVREAAIGDGDIANAVMSQVMELIGEGHTEVSPDVITTKVSAALGRPFMLKDLVAANNASPELQHYISSINPSKVKFSTDILTVKNEDPMKAKEQAQAGIEKMAARAAGRDRSLGESVVSATFKNKDNTYGWEVKKDDKVVAKSKVGEKTRARAEKLANQKKQELAEGWESGPEERGRSMRDLADDPDWAYDQARQEKIDRAAEKEIATKYYVYDNMEKKKVSKDFDSMDLAVAARNKIQQNKAHLSIQSYKALSEAPIEIDPEQPMNPMIFGAGANPAKLSYRMKQAQKQLADLAEKAKTATPQQWQQIAYNFDELLMNINQIKHALSELAKVRQKGGIQSRGIDPELEADLPLNELESFGTGATDTNTQQQAAKVAQATNTLKAATGASAPAPKIAQAINKISQGQQVSTQELNDLKPMISVLGKAASDPDLANQFKSLIQRTK